MAAKSQAVANGGTRVERLLREVVLWGAASIALTDGASSISRGTP